MKSSSKHIPMRTCAACHGIKPQHELVRLVKIGDGSVEVDIKGKNQGRGGYLCPSKECWLTGLTPGHLDRVLRTSITPENKARLIEQGNTY